MDTELKEVRFDIYCGKCKHQMKDERLDPCNECLDIGYRENTHVPEYWEGNK